MQKSVGIKEIVVGISIVCIISGILPCVCVDNNTLFSVSIGDDRSNKILSSIDFQGNSVHVLYDTPVNNVNSTNLNQALGNNVKLSSEYDTCYGYAIPLIRGEHLPYTSIQQNIANLINDLLRLNISVFWASDNFTALTVGVSDTLLENRFFEKGTYIVPISGNLSQDALLAVIINDYAYRNEIETRDRVEVYYIVESLGLDVFPLNYAKIAYHFGAGIHYYLLLCYLDSFQMGGFLDNRLLLDNDIAPCLNINDFNVFIWSGACLSNGLLGWRGTIQTSLHVKASQIIRRFVEHGGGYIGSCYGKASASSGYLVPLRLFAHFFPNLPVTNHLSLLPSSFSTNPGVGYITVKITNMSHPVSFGLSQMQRSWRAHGPVDVWMGKDAQPLATLENFSFQWKGKDFTKIPYWVIDLITQCELGRPIWTTGTYFDGKIVAFGDHPEAPEPSRLDRLLHNSVFFTTADPKKSLTLSENLSVLKIQTYCGATSNLSLNESDHVFTMLWAKLEAVTEICKTMDSIEKNIMNIGLELYDKEKIDSTLRYKLSAEYRDSYQRWLGGFREALQKFENIYNKTHSVIDISSDIQRWEQEMNDTLAACELICRNACEMSQTMFQELTNFTGEYQKTFLIRLLANERDTTFRNGSKHIIIPWMSTEKLSRKLWYEYERDLALRSNPQHQTSIILSTERNQQQTRNCTSSRDIFVDTDAPPNGNGSNQHPFRFIQDAVDAASDQDTIFVSEGLYKETISIHKSITLIGEHKETTIIDGEQKPHCVVITTVPNVQITGFTIKNSSKQPLSAGLLLQDSNNTIQNNIFTDNRLGLGLRPMVRNNIIKNNIFINNSCIGLVIDELTSTNNTISNNTFIENNQQGLSLANVVNTIVNNTFIDDSISFLKSNEPLVPLVKNNIVNGKPVYYLTDKKDVVISGDVGCIILSHCENIKIHAISIHNIDTAICIVQSNNISILNCSLNNNLIGINIQYSRDLIIKNTCINNNSWAGIWAWNSNNIQIYNNTFAYNDDGVIIQSSKTLNIQNNTITTNTIGITFMTRSTNNIVTINDFIDNTNNAFDTCHNNYRSNYWDDWIGVQRSVLKFLPYHVKGRVLVNYDRTPASEPYGFYISNMIK